MAVYDDQNNPKNDRYRQAATDDAQMRAIAGAEEEAAMDASATEENDRFNEWMSAKALELKEKAIEEGKEFAGEEAKGFVKSQFGGDGPYKPGQAGYDNIVGRLAKRYERLILPRKRGFLGGFGILAIFAVVSYLFFAVWQGPAQFVVFANYLRETHFYANHYVLNNRLGKVMVYAWTVNNPQNRNLSVIGNKFANHYENRLKKVGIDLEFDGTTRIRAITIDTTTPAGQKAKDHLIEAGIPASELDPPDGSKGVVRVELIRNDVPKGTSQFRRQAVTGMVSTLGLNNVSGAMGGRLLRLRAGVDFHPLKNMVRDVDENILDYFRKVTDSEEQRIKYGVDPPNSTTVSESDVAEGQEGGDKEVSDKVQEISNDAQGEGSVESRANTVRGKLTAGFGVTAVMGLVCGLDAIGDASVDMAYQQVNLPLERTGIQYQAMGDQVKADMDVDQDVNTDELGYYHDKFYDPVTNTTIWDTDSIRTNQGNETIGFPLPEAAYPTNGDKPFFFGQLSDTISAIPGGNTSCDAMTSTVGGWAFTVVGIALTATGPVAATLQLASEVIQDRIINSFLDDIIAWLAGDQVDVLAKGATLGAYADIGANMAANDGRIAFGATEMNKQEVAQLNEEMNLAKNEEKSRQSYFARYLDITNPDSLASTSVMDAPFVSFASFKNSLATMPKSFASSLSSTLMSIMGGGSVNAADQFDYSTITAQYGFTVDEMDSIKYDDPYENESEIIDQLPELNEKYGTPCFNTIIDPETGAYKQTGQTKIANDIPDYCKDRSNETLTRYRFYLADNLAAITAACYEGIQVEGRDFCAEIGFGDILVNPNQTAAFRVGTFNVLGWEYTEPGGKKASWPSGQKRLVDAFKIIEADGIDVLGLQELQPEQRKKFMDDIAGTEWTMYPDPAKYENYSSSNSIVWKNSEFDFLASGYQTNLQYFDGNQMDAPWVKLRHKLTGEVIYFKNTHDPVDVENEKYRRANANDYKTDAINRMNTGEKVIFVGDFNSNTDVRKEFDGNIKRENLPYCIMTEGLQVQNAYDTSNGTPGNCPTTKNLGIDHIYHTNNVSMSGWTKNSITETQQLSDHPLVYADVLVGSTGSVGSGGGAGWEWPIKKEDWPKLSQPISECDLRYDSGTSYATVHTGIDISAGSGVPVYAAADGVVSMTSSSYGAINIETNEKDSAGAKLYINYQHMSKTLVEKGDKVLKGQTVVGYVGSKGTGGVHLHFGIWRTNSFLSGHMSPSSPAGQRVVSQILNPYDFMPKDGRNVNECN